MSSVLWRRHNDRVTREIKRLSLMSDWLMRCVPAESRPAVMVRPGAVVWSTHVDEAERERDGRSAQCRITPEAAYGISLHLIDHGTGAEFRYTTPPAKGGLAWSMVDAWVERGALLRRAEEYKAGASVLVSVVNWED